MFGIENVTLLDMNVTKQGTIANHQRIPEIC